MSGSARDNRPLGRFGAGARWGSALVALCAAALGACTPTPSVDTVTEHALVRLGDAPPPSPTRVRMLVADLGASCRADDDDGAAVARVEAFAARAAAFEPNVVVLRGFPLQGAVFSLDFPGGGVFGVGGHTEVVDPAELVAVELDLLHRAHIGRYRADACGRGGLETVWVASVCPLESASSGAVTVACPTFSLPLGLDATDRGVETLTVPPTTAGAAPARLPAGWELLRASTDPAYADAVDGLAARYELAPPLAPPPVPQ